MTEEFTLSEHDGAITLAYAGELGCDFGAAGQWWASQVAGRWEAAVRASFAGIKAESRTPYRPRRHLKRYRAGGDGGGRPGLRPAPGAGADRCWVAMRRCGRRCAGQCMGVSTLLMM